MLQLEDISKSFGSIQALHPISTRIRREQITIIAGADGAGKSTLLKILVGLVGRDQGRLWLKGKEISKDFSPITTITGYMPETFSLYHDLTVNENLNFFADIHQVHTSRRNHLKNRLLEKTGMSPFKNRKAGALSGGMKQKLALSAILLFSPEFIILDEPTTGVDPLSRIEFFEIIEDLKAEGSTILISTPYLDEAEKGDTIIFLKQGRLLIQDSLDVLKETFPCRLYRYEPAGDIFSVFNELGRNPQLQNRICMKGNGIQLLIEKDMCVPAILKNCQEINPSLEDIYLYYDRVKTSNEN